MRRGRAGRNGTGERRPHEVTIDRVVLPSGTVGTARVRAAIERELVRLLAAEPTDRDAALAASDVAVDAGADANAIGVEIARQIHAKLDNGKR